MVVRSASEIIWTYALSSDILYPSNVNESKQVLDKGSIRESIPTEKNELFNVTQKTTACYRYLFYVRPLARQVTFFAIGMIVAPFGIFGHGVAAIFRSGKRTDHLKACSSDATVFAITAIGIGIIYSIRYWRKNPEKWNELSVHQKSAKIRLYFYGSVASLGYTAIGTWDPRISAQLLTFRDERTGFYKSLCLKNDFGITSESGHLLKYDSRQDDEGIITYIGPGRYNIQPVGTFFELLISFRVDMTWKLQELERDYPTIMFSKSNPTPENLRLAILVLKQSEAETSSTAPCNPNAMTAVHPLDIWLREYTQLWNNDQKIQKLIKECVEIKMNSMFQDSDQNVTFTPPKFQYGTFSSGGGGGSAPADQKSWKEYQDTNIPKFPTTKPANLLTVVQDFEARFKENTNGKFDKESKRYAYIIGANDPKTATFEDVKSCYKLLAIKLHPDKNPGSLYHEELFKVLGEVYTRAEKAFKEGR